MKSFFVLSFLLLSIASVSADMQAPIPLWPEGAPGALGSSSNDVPTITPYLVDPTNKTGAAMVICPGGAYVKLAPHEGHDQSPWKLALHQVRPNRPDTITIVTNDNGHTGTGGSLSATGAVPVNVAPVNDAPVNALPATFNVAANTTAALAGISVADPDAESGTMTTTLSVGHGTLSAASVGGAVLSGNGTTTLALTGTLAEINATLTAAGNLTYHGDHDFFGIDTLRMVSDDGGNTGSGGVLGLTTPRRPGIGGGEVFDPCAGVAVAAGRPGGRDAPVDTAIEVTPTAMSRPDRGGRAGFRCMVSRRWGAIGQSLRSPARRLVWV